MCEDRRLARQLFEELELETWAALSNRFDDKVVVATPHITISLICTQDMIPSIIRHESFTNYPVGHIVNRLDVPNIVDVPRLACRHMPPV